MSKISFLCSSSTKKTGRLLQFSKKYFLLQYQRTWEDYHDFFIHVMLMLCNDSTMTTHAKEQLKLI